jgi:hypothetical protein
MGEVKGKFGICGCFLTRLQHPDEVASVVPKTVYLNPTRPE